ncbi:MAG: acylneuraminate cytidylyltransferase [bacterium]
MSDSIICIIPARGGSKQVKRKNVRLMCGKPLIYYTIEHAKRSNLIDKIYVSTEDSEISAVAKKCGSGVIVRPESLAADDTSSEAVLQHALEHIEGQGVAVDLVVFLQCTSPLRNEGDIDRAIKRVRDEGADSLLSVTSSKDYLWKTGVNGPESINYDYRNRQRRQDCPSQWRENGSIYIFKPDILKRYKNRLGGKIAIYEMDYWSSFEVDTAEDWRLCEWIMSAGKSRLPLPRMPRIIVTDFDGVMTDNRVLVDSDGTEHVACSRADGMYISILRNLGVEVVVLSSEKNDVVKRRCEKLGVKCYSGCDSKLNTFKAILADYGMTKDDAVYVGNDLNDLDCIRSAGWGLAVSDSADEVLRFADAVLESKGGQGVFREIAALIRTVAATKLGGHDE